MYPEDLDAVTWVLLAVAGVGILAIVVIGFGFPLGDRRYKQNVAQEFSLRKREFSCTTPPR
jgi:hypothetical protein